MRKRRFFILALVLAPFLLPAAFLVEEHVRGKISLAHYQRQLSAQGKKVTPRDFGEATKPGENAAPEIRQAAKQLKAGRVLPKNYLPRMRLLPSGRARVGSRQDYWVEDKVTNHWDDVSADLEQNQELLQSIRAALERPVLNNNVDFSAGNKMTFTHMPIPKSLTTWFSAASQLALHEGRNREAMDFVVAETHLPRFLAEDHLAISELVRFVIAAISRTDSWEALQADEWSDADLLRLQQAWESQSFLSSLPRGLEGEMAFEIASYDLCRASNPDTIAMIFGMEEYLSPDESERAGWERTLRDLPGGEWLADVIKKEIYCRIWRFAWLDQDERRSLEFLERLATIALQAASNKSLVDAQPKTDQLVLQSEHRNLYDKLRFPNPNSAATLSRVVSRAMRIETERSLVLCAIALKRAWLQDHKFPASLEALVPRFVPSVPVDYMNGKPMQYRLNPDGTFTLYSVGEDLKDDGGDATLREGKSSRRDLWSRKDFVWPTPASPEELDGE